MTIFVNLFIWEIRGFQKILIRTSTTQSAFLLLIMSPINTSKKGSSNTVAVTHISQIRSSQIEFINLSRLKNSLDYLAYFSHQVDINSVMLKRISHILLNPLSANPTRWSNTLKQFVCKS